MLDTAKRMTMMDDRLLRLAALEAVDLRWSDLAETLAPAKETPALETALPGGSSTHPVERCEPR